MTLGRRRLPAHLAERRRALLGALTTVDSARGALTACVPSARLPGRQLAEGIAEFDELLREVEGRMDAWRAPELESEWSDAAAGVAEALRRADRLRTEGPNVGDFGGLTGAVDHLLGPLEAFEAAARRFRELRT